MAFNAQITFIGWLKNVRRRVKYNAIQQYCLELQIFLYNENKHSNSNKLVTKSKDFLSRVKSTTQVNSHIKQQTI